MALNIYPALRPGTNVPRIRYVIGAKQAISANPGGINIGDPIVFTTYNNDTTLGPVAAMPVARKLLAADVTASYTDGSAHAVGIAGFAAHNHFLDSSGNVSGQVAITGVSAASQPTSQLAQYASGIPVDPTYGLPYLKIWLVDEMTEFWGKLGGGGTTTATQAIVGKQAGIDIASTGTSAVFTIDTSETVKILEIIGWDPLDTTRVKFKMVPTYIQWNSQYNYTAQ